MRSPRGAVVRTHAVFVDVEALWSKVEFGDAARGLRSEKERSYLAAYDAPFHGVPGHTPYAHGRYSDMNDHIAKVHSRFLESSRRALCGHELAPEEFAQALARVSTVLGVSVEDAVRCVFRSPELVAASESEIVRGMVELRMQYEGEDLAELVVGSGGALLADAVGRPECETDDVYVAERI